jgi:RNA-binding protein YlmH
MESTKIPKRIIKKQVKKRVIKKQLKKVDKAIVEIAEMKFENYEEKEEKLDALVFLKNQILTKLGNYYERKTRQGCYDQ